MTPKLIIVMEGGLIQNIMADSLVDLAIIDYDIEGIDEIELSTMPFKDSPQAYCSIPGMEIDFKEVKRLYTFIETDLETKENEY